MESFLFPPLPQPRKPDFAGSTITSSNLRADTIDLYFRFFKQEKTGSEDKTKFKPDSRTQRPFLLFTAFEQAEFLDLRVRSRLPPGSHCPPLGPPRSGLPRTQPQPPRGLERDEAATSDVRAVSLKDSSPLCAQKRGKSPGNHSRTASVFLTSSRLPNLSGLKRPLRRPPERRAALSRDASRFFCDREVAGPLS